VDAAETYSASQQHAQEALGHSVRVGTRDTGVAWNWSTQEAHLAAWHRRCPRRIRERSLPPVRHDDAWWRQSENLFSGDRSTLFDHRDGNDTCDVVSQFVPTRRS